MKRSGNIGAAKNMDSVFATFTDDELEQDLIFDEDDQLVEIVEGYTEEGNTIFEEDEEIFKIAHQIEAENDDTPEDVRKDAEKLLGPDNDTDQKITGIENVKDEKIDDSNTIDQLKKNGESEADKELGLDKLEDEYHKDSTVAEDFEKWLSEEYEYDNEDQAEGSKTKFGDKDLDNTMPEEDLKNEEDKNYNDTADASVKENKIFTEAMLLEAASQGFYSINEAQFTLPPKFKNDKKLQEIINNLNEARDLLESKGITSESSSERVLRIILRVLDLIVNAGDTILIGAGPIAVGTLAKARAAAGIFAFMVPNPVTFAIKVVIGFFIDRLLSWAIRSGEENLAMKEANQMIAKLEAVKKKCKADKDKKKIQDQIDKIKKNLKKLDDAKKGVNVSESSFNDLIEGYEYDNEDQAEGSDTKFGDKDLDNSQPEEDVSPKGDENYNSTIDATIKDEPFDEAAFDKWLIETAEGECDEEKKECSCGKEDCPICGAKAHETLAPDEAPTADTGDERHEESNNDPVGVEGEEGAAPGKVDDNSLPNDEDMTPEGSPESDNGDITNDDDTSVEEMFDAWLNESDIETPLGDGETPILPEDVEEIENDLEKAAPKTDANIAETGEQPDPKEGEEVIDNTPSEPENSEPEKPEDLNESFLSLIMEMDDETEEGVPSASDVADAAKTEEEDTESELEDDILADELEKDTEDDDEDVDLEYDPSDEDLVDIASGTSDDDVDEVDESFFLMEARDDGQETLAKSIASTIKITLKSVLSDEEDFKHFLVGWRPAQLVGLSDCGKENKKFLDGEGNTIYMGIMPGLKGSDFIPIAGNISQMKRGLNHQKIIKEKFSKFSSTLLNALKKNTGKNITLSLDVINNYSLFKVTVK